VVLDHPPERCRNRLADACRNGARSRGSEIGDDLWCAGDPKLLLVAEACGGHDST